MSVQTKPTQNEVILCYLAEFGSITQLDAMQLGIMRLASRVSDLRKRGYDIVSEREYVNTRWGKTPIKRYRLGEGGVNG